MVSFEALVRSSPEPLIAALVALRRKAKGDEDAVRGRIAQQLGVNITQLVCGLGFNPNTGNQVTIAKHLGFKSLEAFTAERNYQFIHDRYRSLSINNVLEIYAAAAAQNIEWSDLVISRLNNIEAQLEETINPVLIGSYKLEIRAIYERKLASPALVKARLDANYAVLRDITNEAMIMLESGAVSPQEFMSHAGLSIEERSRAVFQRLVPTSIAEKFLQENPGLDAEGKLRAAIAGVA